MAKSRHRKAESLRICFHPNGEDMAAVTAFPAPGAMSALGAVPVPDI